MDRPDEQDFNGWLASHKQEFDAAMREGVKGAEVLQAVKRRSAEKARREIEARVAVAVTGAPESPEPDWPSERWEQLEFDVTKLVNEAKPHDLWLQRSSGTEIMQCKRGDGFGLLQGSYRRHTDISHCRELFSTWLAAEGEQRLDAVQALERIVALVKPLAYRYTRAVVSIHGGAMDSADDLARHAMGAMLCELPTYTTHRQQPFLQFAYNVLRREVQIGDSNACDSRAASHRWWAMHWEPRSRQESMDSGLFLLLQTLDPNRREVLVLRVVVGLSAEATATALDTNPKWVRQQQHRALQELRCMLSTIEQAPPQLE